MQKRPELATGTNRTGTGRVSAAQAQMNATTQPTTVQPSNRFTRKIRPASDFSRPIIVGRKYIKPRNSRKSMARLLPQGWNNDRNQTTRLSVEIYAKTVEFVPTSIAGEFDAISSSPFGGIEGRVGPPQQLGKFVATFCVKTGNAKT